jgi:hypothetical protein
MEPALLAAASAGGAAEFVLERCVSSMNIPVMSFRSFCTLLFVFVTTAVTCGQERLFVDGYVNKYPVRFCFDTGAGGSMLYDRTVTRLGLKVKDGVTEKCDIHLWYQPGRGQFGVMDIPKELEPAEEGVIGWGLIRDEIVHFDVAQNRVYLEPRLPADIGTYRRLPLWNKDLTVLALKVAVAGQGDGMIVVDTGSFHGVGFSPAAWEGWRREHPEAPITLRVSLMMIGDVRVEQSWAKRLSIGGLDFTEMLVEQCFPIPSSWRINPQALVAILGLPALRDYDVIVDRKNAQAYFRQHPGRAINMDHNRLGAVFMHRSKQDPEMVAYVAAGTPAFESGIRDGDILLKYRSGAPSEPWKTATREVWGVLKAPPKTRIEFVLKRNGEVFQTNAVLRDILGKKAK